MTSTLGERIRWIIKEKQLKQVDFARSLGISANYVYLLTSGKKDTISEPLAKLIESTYGYPASWVLTGKFTPREVSSQTELQAETIRKVKRMSERELVAVSAFIRSLEALEREKEKRRA